MKKVEKDFLKDFSNSIDSNYSYDRLKDEVNINRFLVEHKSWKKWVTLAISCFVFFVLIGGSVFAISVEAKEYKNAVQFFNDYELSVENLSRSDIKAIYRDITTKSFSYSKTGEVISKTFMKNVSGYQIPQDKPTPEEIANLWNYLKKIYDQMNNNSEKTGIYYQYNSTYNDEVDINGVPTYDKSIFEKYCDQKLLWELEFNNYFIDDYIIINDLIIIYGHNPVRNTSQIQFSWIVAVDNNGNILWQKERHNGFGRESIRAVIDNGDNTMAIISRGEFSYLCITQMDFNGNVLKFNKKEVGNYGISNATNFEDGYLIQLTSIYPIIESKIIWIDKEANIEESFAYESIDSIYFIIDMIEYNNKIYLSAYSVPKTSESSFGSRNEIAEILSYIYDNQLDQITSEELTPIIRENYTALLLVCDSKSGNPDEFYSVAGSLGAKLSYSESGQLLWDVESITSTYYSPATSSFTIGGVSKVYQYSFDNDGMLIWQKDTGKIVQFRR